MIAFSKPALADVASMQALVRPYVNEGIVLSRTDDEVANTIRSYTVGKEDEKLVGFGALYIYSAELAEIRSLAVSKEARGRGIGRGVVEALLQEARALGIHQVLSLTYQRSFFNALGFHEISKEAIPDHKVWEDCIRCKHFPICDEIAMIINL